MDSKQPQILRHHTPFDWENIHVDVAQLGGVIVKGLFSDEDITKFQTLYKKHFGEEISRERAHSEGIKLVRLMPLIYKPMTKAQYERLQERRRFLDAREVAKNKKDG